MVKYSDEHLEKVPVEFIIGFEETIRMLGSGYAPGNPDTCPITAYGLSYHNYRCVTGWCNENMLYGKDTCPCYIYEREDVIEMGENLISQWKKWAKLEETE